MLGIVMGIAAMLFRKRLAAATIRSQEKLMATRLGTVSQRSYEWVWALTGGFIAALGFLEVLSPFSR